MYSALLSIHSVLRWLVVLGVIYTLYRAYSGLFSSRAYDPADDKTRKYTVIFAHLQVVAGILLFIFSPLTQYFINNFSAAVKIKEMRFYAMEHSITLLIAVILLTIGSAIAKKKTEDKAKFKALAIWFTIALILLLLMIPWPISPFSGRPWLRL